tara:strand:+ start:322 stop:705 length:384 start_codon:yes stop_codon:yes gene_type:complete
MKKGALSSSIFILIVFSILTGFIWGIYFPKFFPNSELYLKDNTSMSLYHFLWNFLKIFVWLSFILIFAFIIGFFDKKFYQNEILKERWFNLSKNNFLNQLSSIIIYSSIFSGFWYLIRLLTVFLNSI